METEYKIIGGDGVEYGPASLLELRDWIRDGRVAGTTQVWRSDLLKWSPANWYQELQADLSRLYSVSPEAARPAGFWMRLAAHLLDRALLLPLFLAVWFPIADANNWIRLPPEVPSTITDETRVKYTNELSAWMDHAALVYLPIFMIYEVLLNGAFGATVGKMAIGARIRAADGARLSYSRAMLRWWAERVSEFLMFTGFLLIALRADKRGLHDILAGTKVVYQR
ncbi:MAG TPA: RDD family protein [Verrucomicrobiae bacterium]|jgi:uncharacterized RDD family membrane protein YckC|nr:RDD family protein [Verrucomicrobiae bacterium]